MPTRIGKLHAWRHARHVQYANVGPSTTQGDFRRILIDTRELPQSGQCPPHRVMKNLLIQSNIDNLHGIVSHLGLILGLLLPLPTTV